MGRCLGTVFLFLVWNLVYRHLIILPIQELNTMQERGCTKPVSVREMRIESLPFSSIPSQSKLFLEYQKDPVSLKRYYPSAVASPSQIADRAEEVLSNYKVDRNLLCDALERINTHYEAPAETLANIGLLRESDAVAVLTGQQTGLFTGPLYSIYKALSAIRMAERLRDEGVKAVPVFWMATEDHDFKEISNAFSIDSSGALFESSFSASEGDEGKSVGAIKLDASVTEIIGELFDSLPSTEFSDSLKDEVGRSWKLGTSLGTAFGHFLIRLLGKYGLIVVDPRDPALKKLAAPVYAQAIRANAAIVSAVRLRSTDLEDSGYAAQVLVEEDYFPLFYHTDDGRRVALRRVEDGLFQAKGERTRFTTDELVALAESEPLKFSPGVMLRPVVQDYLFPTLCYFGGGAEIAYFAQNREVYRVLARPVTPILHRQSFTVVEAKHARTLEKYGLKFSDLFAGQDQLLPEIVDRFIDPATATIFAEAEERIDSELNRLDQALANMDVTLAANLATRRRKINYHIAALRKKYQFRRAEQDIDIGRRITAAFTDLYPLGHLQERTLNVISFLDRLGPAFIDTVYGAIDLDDTGHRVIYL